MRNARAMPTAGSHSKNTEGPRTWPLVKMMVTASKKRVTKPACKMRRRLRRRARTP